MRSEHQRVIYLIFKILFYKWIKPLDQEKLPSYIAKTIVFWTCENYPPEHVIWKNDFKSTIKIIELLLEKVLEN